jgi:hypothetical protein
LRSEKNDALPDGTLSKIDAMTYDPGEKIDIVRFGAAREPRSR